MSKKAKDSYSLSDEIQEYLDKDIEGEFIVMGRNLIEEVPNISDKVFKDGIKELIEEKMKKTYEASKKSRSHTGWWKHLRRLGKRIANKSHRGLWKKKLKGENE